MKKLFVVLALVFVSSNSFAGILLEPYLGYHLGSTTQTGSSDAKDTGVGYGARIGWTLPLVFFAFDYGAASIKDKPDTGTDADLKLTDMGIVAGVSLPVVRLWAGYNLKSKFKPESGSAFEGKGMKAGLGLKLIPMVPISFNLEYIMDTFDEAGGSTIEDIKLKSIFISVSAPLTF